MRVIKWILALAVICLWSASVAAQPNNCYNIPNPTAADAGKTCDFSNSDQAPLTSGVWKVEAVDNLDSGDCPLLNDELAYQFTVNTDGDQIIMRLGSVSIGGRKFTRTDDEANTYVYTRTTRINSINYTLEVIAHDHFTITWVNPFKTCEVVEDYTLIKADK